MFKRVRWMSIGAVVGLGGSVWAQRRVRRTVDRYLPDEVVARAGGRVRDLRGDVRDAIDEGRQAMHAREAELRAQLDGPPPSPSRPPLPRPGAARPEVIDVDELLGAGRAPISRAPRPSRRRRG